MKTAVRFSTSATLVSALVSITAHAEGPQWRPHSLQADLGLAVAGIAYEHRFIPAHWFAVRGALQATYPWYTGKDVKGISLELRPMFYFGSLNAFYVSPFFRAASIRTTEGGSYPGWTAGITAGYTHHFGAHWMGRVGAGAQYFAYAHFVDATKEVGLAGVWPDVDLVVGYRF